MRGFLRSLLVTVVALLGAVALAIGSTLTLAVAATTALIMGGTGRPNPADFPGYIPNVTDYYIIPNSACTADDCDQVPVFTPETAWPVYGGADALTWQQSILQGVELYDAAVQPRLGDLDEDNRLVLFGYSQSGAILAYEKIRLAGESEDVRDLIEIVVIGNVSRPNGGLNSRVYPFSIPIVQFPFGPPMPNDPETGIKTTDIAMKWDIIADAPLYITNPLAMTNALLGFWYVHGTYPDPTEADPTDTPGGYSVDQWQDMMDNPQDYPDLIDIETTGETTYYTVTPTVLPLVMPLHQLGLKPLADLIEPALRVIIEQTGYDRSIPYGQVTGFRLIPLFNPIKLAVDVAAAIPAGIEQMLAGLNQSADTAAPDAMNALTNATEEPASEVKDSKGADESNSPTGVLNDTTALNDTRVLNDTTALNDTKVSTDTKALTDASDDALEPAPHQNLLLRGISQLSDQVTGALRPRDSDQADESASKDEEESDDPTPADEDATPDENGSAENGVGDDGSDEGKPVAKHDNTESESKNSGDTAKKADSESDSASSSTSDHERDAAA